MSARLVFMGSPEFAVPSLHALAGAGHDIALAVTQPDRPAGRGGRLQPPPVKRAAMELGIGVFQPDSLRDSDVQATLRDAQADVFVVAAYGKILPQAVLDIPRRGCVNVHASLLPRWRGPSPVVAAILAGDPVTGVSIMELVRKMDAGPVISRVAIPVGERETAGELEGRLAGAGAAELVRVLPGWLAGELAAEPQDESLATYCHILRKEDGWLRREMSAAEAERAVRAYNPWPGAFVMAGELRLSIWRAGVLSESPPAAPGAMGLVARRPAIAFRDGWLMLEEVQKPGGKRLTSEQYLAGLRGQLPEAVTLA